MHRSALLLSSLFAVGLLSASGPGHVFIPNQGQWQGPHLFKAESGNLSLFVERDRFTWSMVRPDAGELAHDAMHHEGDALVDGHAWQVVFEGSKPVEPTPIGRSRHHLNYFLGSDRSRWRGRVHAAEEVMMPGLWEGVDLRVYQNDGNFKYDLLLAPGAAVDQARFRYVGTEGVSVDAQGHLSVRTSVGVVLEQRPVAWYADGAGEPVDCRYVLEGDLLGYVLDDADRSRPIVIDPTLIASTLSGTGDLGMTSNYGHCATYDDNGNIYTGGRCFGQGYPVTLGAFQVNFGGGGTDISVSKLNPDGSDLIWATYLGGSGADYSHSMVVDGGGSLWVYGTSASSDYPVSANAYDGTYGGGGGFSFDIIVTKLTPDGSAIVGSTYVGGAATDGSNSVSNNYGDTYRGEIVVDPSGNGYVASCSQSSDFPVTAGAVQGAIGGAQDAVVFSLDPDLSTLRWSTFLGGGGNEMAYGLKAGPNGDVFVSGSTEGGAGFITAGSYQDAYQGQRDGFVVHLDDDGTTVVAGTYFGTAQQDQAFFLDVDLDGNVYIYGQTDGSIAIQPSGTYGVAGGDIFVAELQPDLSAAVFTTTVGASGGFGYSLVPVAFLVDVCDNIYISGYSPSFNMATTSDALYTSGGFYLAVYDPDMTGLRFGTYYAGADHVDGGTSRFDKNGIVYQAVCTAGPFPTTPNAWSNTQPSGWDIGVFKIDLEQAGVQTVAQASATIGCAPAPIDFTGTGNAQSYVWDFGDGSGTVTGTNPSHTFQQPGTYDVMLIGIDSNTCNVADTSFITVQVNAPGSLEAGFLAEQTTDCSQIEVVATDTTNGALLISSWDMGDGTLLTGTTVYHVYGAPGTYTITLTVVDTLCGDTSTAILPIEVDDGFAFDIGPDQTICPGQSVVLDAGVANASYLWSTNQTSQTISVDQPGTYWVQVDVNGCNGTDTLVVGLFPDPGDLDSYQEVCPGEPIAIGIPIEGTYAWGVGGTTQFITVDTLGIYTFLVTDVYGCEWTGEAVVAPDPNDFEVLVPNVFSPNGDGSNDRFEPQTGGPRDVEVAIYNRWGMEMFSHPNLSKLWDGKHDGNVVPDGTYFYIVKYRPSCQQDKVVKTGHVTVLR